MKPYFNLGKELSSSLSPNNSPLLTVKINNESFSAIIDTGATDNFICERVINRAGLVNPDNEKLTLFAAQSPTEIPLYNIQFRISDIEHDFKDEFGVLPFNYTYDLIFGTVFLSRCQCLIMNMIDRSYNLFI